MHASPPVFGPMRFLALAREAGNSSRSRSVVGSSIQPTGRRRSALAYASLLSIQTCRGGAYLLFFTVECTLLVFLISELP